MREARETFFNRANLLCSLQCGADKVTVLQTMILMTSSTGSSKSLSDTRYFINIAILQYTSRKKSDANRRQGFHNGYGNAFCGLAM